MNPPPDRLLVINNICNSSYFCGNDGNITGGAAALSGFHNLFFDYNLITDTLAWDQQPNAGTHWFKGVQMTAVGFVNWGSSYRPPIPVTNWNLASTSPYVAASSTGGPLGAHF